MSNDDEYRRQAAYAEKQSQLARNDIDRESWLRIAQGYMSLLHKRPQSDEKVLTSNAKTRTGQDDSESAQ